jgi:hypothetical protein
MSIGDVLKEVSRVGLTLRLTSEGGINARPVYRLTPTLRDLLKAHKAELALALSQQTQMNHKTQKVVSVEDALDGKLLEAAMCGCEFWNDGIAARAEMVADINATPQHLRQDLLEHFLSTYGKTK